MAAAAAAARRKGPAVVDLGHVLALADELESALQPWHDGVVAIDALLRCGKLLRHLALPSA